MPHPVGAMRVMEHLLREMDRAAANLPRPFVARRPGPPVAFTTVADPRGRFELSYPSAWKPLLEDGSFFFSAPSGTFARVDVLPESSDYWAALEKAAAACAGRFRVDARRQGRARGELVLDGRRFGWDSTDHARGAERIILTLGNLIDSSRGRTLERYEDKVLAAIRRSFKTFQKTR